MKTSPKNRRHTRSYTEATKIARRLQADLINLVDETLLTDWDDAGALSDISGEIQTYLLELETNRSDGAPPAVINLLVTLNKICCLAEYSYRLKVDDITAPVRLALRAK